MNTQTAVLVVKNGEGKSWVVGTNTRRGFTEAGARQALAAVRFEIPFGWTAYWTNMEALDFVLESCRNLSHRRTT